MAAYHDKLLNDYDSALSLVKEAIKKSPDFLNYRIELINFYLAKGLYKEALIELKILEDKDTYGFNAASINKAYTILESVSHSP
jgi:tetratricopeptide (TPR) repeat protein